MNNNFDVEVSTITISEISFLFLAFMKEITIESKSINCIYKIITDDEIPQDLTKHTIYDYIEMLELSNTSSLLKDSIFICDLKDEKLKSDLKEQLSNAIIEYFMLK